MNRLCLLICKFAFRLINQTMKRILLVLILFVTGVTSFAQKSFIVSSYIRGNFYNAGRIDPAAMNACSDLICLGVMPGADGSLIFEKFHSSEKQTVADLSELISAVKKTLAGDISVRIGVSGGQYWKDMIVRPASRKKFVNQVKQLLIRTGTTGVDLDFEWAQNSQEYADYSSLIVELRNAIGTRYRLTVSLHPISYRIYTDAIDAIDYASLQCYGPSPVRFSYSQYIKDIDKILSYGIPSSKLVPGIPFYGVTADDSKESTAYYNFVQADLITNPLINKVNYNGQSYIFNGQDEVKRKTEYAKYKQLCGIMFWDLATDVPINNQWSLFKAMLEVTDAK